MSLVLYSRRGGRTEDFREPLEGKILIITFDPDEYKQRRKLKTVLGRPYEAVQGYENAIEALRKGGYKDVLLFTPDNFDGNNSGEENNLISFLISNYVPNTVIGMITITDEKFSLLDPQKEYRPGLDEKERTLIISSDRQIPDNAGLSSLEDAVREQPVKAVASKEKELTPKERSRKHTTEIEILHLYVNLQEDFEGLLNRKPYLKTRRFSRKELDEIIENHALFYETKRNGRAGSATYNLIIGGISNTELFRKLPIQAFRTMVPETTRDDSEQYLGKVKEALIDYITKGDLSRAPRKEYKIKTPSTHGVYRILFFPLVEVEGNPVELNLNVIVKLFKKDESGRKLFEKEQEAMTVYSQFHSEHFPYLKERVTTVEDDNYYCLVTWFTEGMDNLESHEYLRRQLVGREIPPISCTEFNEERLRIIIDRVSLTAKTHAASPGYLADEPYTIEQNTLKGIERFLKPIIERNILDEDKDKDLIETWILGRFIEAYYTDKKPKIAALDGIWSNAVRDVPIDFDLIRTVTNMLDLYASLGLGFFVDREPALTLPEGVRIMWPEYETIHDFISLGDGNNKLRGLGFDPSRVSPRQTVSEYEMFCRFYYLKYNEYVKEIGIMPPEKSHDMAEEILKRRLDELNLPEDILPQLTMKFPENYFNSLASKINEKLMRQSLRRDAPDIMEFANTAVWVQRYVSYQAFLNLKGSAGKQKRDFRIARAALNEFFYVEGSDSVFVKGLGVDKKIFSYLKRISRFGDNNYQRELTRRGVKDGGELIEYLEKRVQESGNDEFIQNSKAAFSYLKRLYHAREPEPLKSFEDFMKDPSGDERAVNAYGVYAKWTDELKHTKMIDRYLTYMLSLPSNALRALEEYSVSLDTGEKARNVSSLFKESGCQQIFDGFDISGRINKDLTVGEAFDNYANAMRDIELRHRLYIINRVIDLYEHNKNNNIPLKN